MMLKYIFIIATVQIAMAFTSLSCKKDKVLTFHNDAEILNADKSLRPCKGTDLCNCPGGFFIHIDGVSDPQGKCIACNSFKALQFPDGFDLGDNPAFPVAVTIDWKYDTLSCDSSRISIIHIVKR